MQPKDKVIETIIPSEEELQQAYRKDLINIDTNGSISVKKDIVYYVSNSQDIIERYVSTKHTIITNLLPFIDDNRVFVKKEIKDIFLDF